MSLNCTRAKNCFGFFFFWLVEGWKLELGVRVGSHELVPRSPPCFPRIPTTPDTCNNRKRGCLAQRRPRRPSYLRTGRGRERKELNSYTTNTALVESVLSYQKKVKTCATATVILPTLGKAKDGGVICPLLTR